MHRVTASAVLSAVTALLSAAPLLFAADIYVSPAGNDAAAGTQPQPLREIRKALERAKPGDTILAADGQYKGFTLSNVHGASGKPITVKAPGKKAEILPTTDRRDNRDTMYLDGCSYITLEGLRALKGNRAGLRIEAGAFLTVRDCVFGENGTWGILTSHNDDLLLENNECYASRAEHGIYIGNSSKRPTVRGNRSHDNTGCGIHMNADLGCGPDGVISGAIVENNVIWNNGRKGGGGINMDGVRDSVIANNLLYDNHASGIVAFQMNGAKGPAGLKIVNNTIIMAPDARYALQLGQTQGPCLVRNNILCNLNPNRGGLALFSAAKDVPNVDSDYNIFGKEAAIIALDDWKDRRPLAQWQARGYEKHSFAAPLADLFANPAAKDFTPKPGSPAQGKGDTKETRHNNIGCKR